MKKFLECSANANKKIICKIGKTGRIYRPCHKIENIRLEHLMTNGKIEGKDAEVGKGLNHCKQT